jgi:sarcosine oxidase
MRETFDVAVIGAGVFGAWTAWHLQRVGQRVVLLDPYGPASARASSGGQTRVIRMAYGPDAIYTRMSQRSLVQWKDFFARIARPEWFLATGVLWMMAEADAAAARSVATLEACGVPHQTFEARELARRYPQIAVPPGYRAILEPGSGGLMAHRAVQAVVADCLRGGAEMRITKALPPAGDGHLADVGTPSGDTIRADRFVFACGSWLGHVLPDVLGGRIFPTRQEVFYFGIDAGDTRFSSPALPIWLDSAQQYYGFPDVEGRGFKLAHDAHGEAVDPDTLERVATPAPIAHARAFLADRFPALANAPLLGAEVCQYENTSNGDFVIDRHPSFDNVWIAGGGSGHGFKHGPAVGEYVAQRVLRGDEVDPRFSLAMKSLVQKREVH